MYNDYKLCVKKTEAKNKSVKDAILYQNPYYKQ